MTILGFMNSSSCDVSSITLGTSAVPFSKKNSLINRFSNLACIESFSILGNHNGIIDDDLLDDLLNDLTEEVI
jgi:hypothetical protein